MPTVKFMLLWWIKLKTETESNLCDIKRLIIIKTSSLNPLAISYIEEEVACILQKQIAFAQNIPEWHFVAGSPSPNVDIIIKIFW